MKIQKKIEAFLIKSRIADQEKLGREGAQAGIKNIKKVGVDGKGVTVIVRNQRYIQGEHL